jgi:ectoine hydroxylase-related dioxygenase (phytanoyl-CoA dioxygenase family)
MYETTDREREQYEVDGFFVRERAIPEADLVEVRDAVEEIHRDILDASAGSSAAPVDRVDRQRFQSVLGSTIKWEWDEDIRHIRSMEPCMHLDPRIETLVDDPRIWQAARPLVGTEKISLFSDKLNFKRPGGSPFPWHQESPYWAHGAEQLEGIVSALIYLDDATIDNGCLWVVRGSHRYGFLPSLRDRGVLGALYTDVQALEGAEPVPLAAPAGSILYFHRDLVHGSQTNRSGDNRRALIFAYQREGLRRWRLDQVRPIRS